MQRTDVVTPGRARARGRVSAVIALCLAVSINVHAVASDDPEDKKRKVDQQLSDSRADLHETSGKLVAAYDALRKTRSKLPAARETARKAAEAEEIAEGEYDDAVAALEVAQENERKAERELRRTSGKITRARDQVAGFAGQVYQQQGLGNLTVAVGAESPSDFVDRMILAESAGGVQSNALDELSTSRADLVATGDKLEALREKTKDAKDAKETALGKARTARDKADSAEQDLEDLESRQSEQAATLRKERAKETKRVESLEAQSDKLAKILQERARRAKIREARIEAARKAEEKRRADARARAQRSAPGSNRPSDSTDPGPTSDPNPPAPSSTGVLSQPINAPVTSEYGLRFHPIWHQWRLHAGRDYGAPCGTPVYAAADGEIISAGVAGGYGNQLVIDHGVHRGVSLATTYNHLQSFAKTSGRVRRGQVIAYEGTTGSSTGCHLHFETWENGTAVDPRRWL